MPLSNTDYYRRFMDLYDLLPEVYKSDTTRSAFYNTFNRFLTKSEVKKVAGYIGEPNKNAILRRQIEEDTLHRQAYQLQPLLNTSIGSVRHFASWKDIETEIQRLGVDIERMDEWCSTRKFNWVPPVDIDKLINYYNYYWVDNSTSVPEYITIKSRCAVAVSLVSFWEKIIAEYGNQAQIKRIVTYTDEADYPIFDLSMINGSANIITAKGNVLEYLNNDDFFYIINSQNGLNNGKHRIDTISYSIETDETTIIVVDGTLDDGTYELNNGILQTKFFDKIVLDGKFDNIFTKDFIFFIRNSENKDLNLSFWKTVSSTYDINTSETTVTLNRIFTDNTADGYASFDEQYQLAQSVKACVCQDSAQWDIGQWDDNPPEPLWGGLAPGLHVQWLEEITNTTPPPNKKKTDQWYYTNNDVLYEWDNTFDRYDVIVNNFSFILGQTTGNIFWDERTTCDIESFKIDTADQWITTNKWMHYKDVSDFTTARKAQLPIIEYQWDLLINEWSEINHKWKYRSLSTNKWDNTDNKPHLMELTPLELWQKGSISNSIELDERYGDLTETFTIDYEFTSFETNETFKVLDSYYSRATEDGHFFTTILIDKIVQTSGLKTGDLSTETKSTTPLIPLVTSQGDKWRRYGDHWLYNYTDEPIATRPRPINLLLEEDETTLFEWNDTREFKYRITPQSQTMILEIDEYDKDIYFASDSFEGSTRGLNRRALLGANDVRVYRNGIREYGSFDELEYVDSIDNLSYVGGIRFLSYVRLQVRDEIKIEVGESTQEEVGLYSVPVRVHESNNDYKSFGDVNVSLVSYKKLEQTKTKDNQYPIFDIFNPIGSHSGIANNIFGYRTDQDYPANNAVDLRIVHDSDTKIFEFEQHLIDEDNGNMYAYRDFSNLKHNYWFHPLEQVLLFWVEGGWSFKALMGNHYRLPVVSAQEPDYRDRGIHGLYWYDTANNELKVRDIYNQSWNVIDDVEVSLNDHTLQTIWRSGHEGEVYTPQKVDWDRRTQEEYNEEKEIFVENATEELMVYYPEMSEEEAQEEATNLWYEKESNPHSPPTETSPGGEWVGDWELPDQLFHNHMHENRKIVNSAEVRNHFNSIIQNQPVIPGYTEDIEDMYRLIPINDVNYGVGGTIHEYNDGFDTFLSSAFVNNVTPISLIDFASSQYEVLLINSIVDVYRQNIADYLTDTSFEAKEDMGTFISDSIITQHNQNDYFNFVYGDTTTFNDEKETGVRNWIATLPYINLMYAKKPSILYDQKRNISELRHHDGHFGEYSLHDSEAKVIIRDLLTKTDERSDGDTWCKLSAQYPPDNLAEFTSHYGSIENREGVMWYMTYPSDIVGQPVEKLYRLNLVHTGAIMPVRAQYEDGALWFDTGSNVLKIKKTNTENYNVWEIVDGLQEGDERLHNGTDPNDITTARISAWQEMSFNKMLVDVIYDIEIKLYENAPSDSIRYNVNDARNIDPIVFDGYLEDAFFDYVTEREIINPLSNLEYSADDSWTWNYKHCIPGGGYSIVECNSETNEIHVLGDHTSIFDPCYYDGHCPSSVDFYIRNSVVNDGSWSTVLSDGRQPIAQVYQNEAQEDITVIRVEGDVFPSIEGYIYIGELPGSINDGSESGAHWQIYYRELYGTPYPHLEPWKLQGYDDEPDWWEEEYKNNDHLKWGNRVWKYKHGFEINAFANIFGRGSYFVDGEFLDVFLPKEKIYVDNSDITNDFEHTVIAINSIKIYNKELSTIEVGGDYEYYYDNNKVIGVVDSANNYIGSYRIDRSEYLGPPSNNTVIYLREDNIREIAKFSAISSVYYIDENHTIIQTDASILPRSQTIRYGRIAKAYGMWENIRLGNIPPGRPYPNNIVSKTGIPSEDRKEGIEIENLVTWNYFSVNIDNNDLSTDGGNTLYPADSLFPPYWDTNSSEYVVDEIGVRSDDITLELAIFDSPVRSVFNDYLKEIVAPSADYVFGDGGPIEWEWRKSARYLFDTLKASYRIDPVRYVTHTFGTDFYIIDSLQLDTRTNNTFAHNRTNFHGDIIEGETQKFSGTNQWYVNFNRYLSFDNNFSDFANMWKNWKAPMTYQFATFVDTPSLQVAHRYIQFTKYDYTLDTKKSTGVEDYWLDAFKMAITKIPPDIMRYDTQNEWGIEMNTHVSVSRNLGYYDVQNYQFYIDPDTAIGTIYTWEIKSVDVYNKFFEIEGDQVHYFERDKTFTIHQSYGNDGTYSVYKSVFNEETNRTIIETDQIISSISVDGLITLDEYRTLPWETGEKIHISSTETLPSPLTSKTSEGLNEYFFIKVNEYQFKIANTLAESHEDVYIDIHSVGRGNHSIGKIHSIFKSLQTKTVGLKTDIDWIHYEMDNTNTLYKLMPSTIKGMQNFINFIDGYSLFTANEGWKINDQNSMTDRITNRRVSWQGEIEKFIDYAYTLRAQKYSYKDKYQVTVDTEENSFTFMGQNPMFRTGDKIKFQATNNNYPYPIYRYLDYCFVYVDGSTFKIAASKRDAEKGVTIDILSDVNVEELYVVKPPDRREEYPRTGINPFRTAIWFRQPRGVISNIVSGPSEDIRTIQTIVDQYGRRVDVGNIRVFREDRRTQISVKEQIPNMIEPPIYYVYPGDYDYIHIAGLHLFLDTYEHAMVFNNYTTEEDLIYDPFLGANATKFEMLFNRQIDFTHRPNIGGYFYHNKNNIGSDLIENIEQGVESLRYAYDTFHVLESNKMAKEVRNSVGYTGIKDYLSLININEKSQFLFWRGFIHQKGTTRSIDAYLNSRRFVNAAVDEFWAIKIADFGSDKDKEYIEIYLNTADLISEEAGFIFIDPTEDETTDLIIPEIPGYDPDAPKECFMITNINVIEILQEGETELFIPTTCPIGNMVVYINGVKMSSYAYEQVTGSKFRLEQAIQSTSDVVDAGSMDVGECDDILSRKSFDFTNVMGMRKFVLDFPIPMGNLNVFINGLKLSNSEYTQLSTKEFELLNLAEEGDIIEVESWEGDTGTTTRHIVEFPNVNINSVTFTVDTNTHNNYLVYVNGVKIADTGFESKEDYRFTLKEGILSGNDLVQVEWWVVKESI